MRLLPSPGRVVGMALRGIHLLGRGMVRGSRWSTRRIRRIREKGAGGDVGMARLFDLHAASCAGDTLIAIGLAGTIFFDVPLGEARTRVALYLLVTMVPFAVLAPVVGPLLDRFRHGRRYALAATMLGRAFLAWLISDYINGFGLYPAAFGVLALSRAYGVGRSAVVPRLLPAGLGLSQAGARASVYGSIAGALVAPIGLAAFLIGPQWPLRIASLIFIVGMIIALRLPPQADSESPRRAAVALLPWRHRERKLTGPLVIAALLGSGCFRALYGFLFLFLAFAVKAGDLSPQLVGRDLGDERTLALLGAAFAAGTFLATAVGTRLRIHRPVALQAAGLLIVTVLGALATLRFSVTMVILLCLGTAILSGLAKLAVDAVLQERVTERLRASAFAHAETILMLAFVGGGALGLIPLPGRVGIVVATAAAAVAAVWAVGTATRLRRDRLHGRATTDTGPREGAGTAGEALTGAAPSPSTSTVPLTTPAVSSAGSASAATTSAPETTTLAPPGYHIYRPSSASGPDSHETPGDTRRESPGLA